MPLSLRARALLPDLRYSIDKYGLFLKAAFPLQRATRQKYRRIRLWCSIDVAGKLQKYNIVKLKKCLIFINLMDGDL